MSPGLSVAHYRITAKLGEGGMGEVWRASDTKLGRDVAIKILPPAFAQDPERMARFTREARVLASLNHPRIAAIYGLEVFEEIRFLVLELVEGPTLAERLASGRIEIGEALRIGIEIAEGLEAAHEKGVIHRDLKPGNLKLTADDQVKILDFGLAKAVEEPTIADPSSPTMTMPPSVAGLILGTPAYMSPEQAQGKPLDKRTDIWSFGVVMYEMLTGKRPFTGGSMADILAAVLRAGPDWGALPIGTPPGIRKLLHRCLERDCKQRLRDIGEARIAIAAPAETAQATGPSQSRLGIMAAGAAALFFVTGALLAIIHFGENRPVAELVRFQIPAPGNSDAYPIVSPNGRLISFEARDSAGRNMLWIRSLDSLDTRPLPGTENSAGFPGFPVWSPDSRYLAFEQQGKLKKVEVSGGAPQALCDYQGPLRGGAWSRQGVIVFGSVGHGLTQVSDSGGAASPVTSIDASRQENFHAINGNSFLPDGRHFVYYRGSRAVEHRAVYVGSLDAKPEQQSSIPLAVTGTSGLYVPSPDPRRGYFLFRREGALLAQPFDNRRSQLAGEAVLLSRDIPNAGPLPFSASETGVLTYLTASPSALSQLTWLDRDGRKLATVGEPGLHWGICPLPGRSASGSRPARWIFGERKHRRLDL
jgi:serine/threonine protein kinase